jgi:hypothetical protein
MMNAQLTVNFNNQDDLFKVLQFLKDIGLDKVSIASKPDFSEDTENTMQETKNDAYTEAQLLKGDVPTPIFALDKYSVYEQ